jgi:hypothetical protein
MVDPPTPIAAEGFDEPEQPISRAPMVTEHSVKRAFRPGRDEDIMVRS